MRKNAVLGNIVSLGNGSSLFVATAADIGYVELGDFRIWRIDLSDIVRAVTCPATRRQLGSLSHFFPVQTACIYGCHIVVAIAAIYGLDIFFMRKVGTCQVLVASNTFELSMNRFFEYLMVDIERDCLAVSLSAEGIITMA